MERKKNIKKYVSKFIELHDCKFDKKKKVFATSSEN